MKTPKVIEMRGYTVVTLHGKERRIERAGITLEDDIISAQSKIDAKYARINAEKIRG